MYFCTVPSILCWVFFLLRTLAQDEGSDVSNLGNNFTSVPYSYEPFSTTEADRSQNSSLESTTIPITPSCRCSSLMSEVAMERGWSGNPGYIEGLPVRTGKLIQQADPGGLIRQAVLVSRTNSRFTTISPSYHNQECPDLSNVTSNQVPVAFRRNTDVQCYWHWSEWTTCSQIQANIWRILLGMDEEGLNSVSVGAWGNSAPERLGDWLGVTVFHNSRPEYKTSPGTCFVAREVHATVFYTEVGSVDAPQARIVGVAYVWKPALPLSPNKVWLRARVQFRDVSLAPKHHFAPTLALNARLPHDFFYPFFLNAGHQIKSLFPLYFMIGVYVFFSLNN